MSGIPGVDDRCKYKTADGRCCTMLRMDDHPSLCYQHWRYQVFQPENEDPESVAAELLGSTEDFTTAAAVNKVLGRLLALLARKRIPPRNAATVAYICQLLLTSLPAVERETLRAQGFFGWEQVTAAIATQLRHAAPAELAKAISRRALPPDRAKGSPRARAAKRRSAG